MSPSSTSHSGAMIALVPSESDLDDLALAGGEPRDELHLTLWYLGDAASIDDATREGLRVAVVSMIERRAVPVVRAYAFGVGLWNPASDDPAWVLNVGDVPPDERAPDGASLTELRGTVREGWVDGGVTLDLPAQYTPWQPHVCVAYGGNADLVDDLALRLGAVTFDRVRLAFGGETTDVPLVLPATVAAGPGGDRVPWHKVHNHTRCPGDRPWAVVRDATGEVEGCHASEADADAQLAALYASDDDATDDCLDCASDDDHGVTLASDAPWNGAASRFTDAEYRRATAACDPGDAPPKTRCFLPHHEPGGALNREGVHAAAARFNQLQGRSSEAVARAKSHLRAHYHQLGEEVPDVLSATTSTEVEVASVAATLARDGDCPPGQHRMPDGSCMTDDEMYAASTWEGVLVVEGTPTGDGREFARDALAWVEGALLRWQKEGSHGGDHDVTVSVGRIDRVWRDGDQVRGVGVLDLLNPDGFELRRRMAGNFAGGISIDADDIQDADVEFVWPEDDDPELDADAVKLLFGRPEKMIYHGGRVRAATVCDIPAFVEARITLTDGVVAEPTETNAFTGARPVHVTATTDEAWDWQPRRATGVPPDAYAWVGATAVALPHHVVVDGDVGAANLTACAAAVARLNGERGGLDLPTSDRRATYEHLAAHLRDAGQEPPPLLDLGPLVAAVGAVDHRPPRAWFDDPGLTVPIGVTVTDQGRVYGHVAQWGECHIGFGDACVTPPYEETHPYFMTGEVLCADGSRIAVGQVTVGTGHAPLDYRASRAAEHYDNTGAAVADVVVGNDAVGIWVAGAVRPYAEAGRVHDLRASGQLSGDWRRIGGELRLVGLLAVNVPGFPVPRLRARVASGVPVALVAAGRTVVSTPPVVERSGDELDRLALRRVMDILARRVNRTDDVEGVH